MQKSNTDKLAKSIANLLRNLAEKIEKFPQLVEGLTVSEKKRDNQKNTVHGGIAIFEIYSSGGEELLRSQLQSLDITALKKVISLHGFDTSKLAQKWRNRDRLIDLIVERVIARSKKGDVFR